MIPSADTDSCSSGPPLKRVTSEERLRLPPLFTALKQLWVAVVETPGAGTGLPTRDNTMIPSVNSSFLRRSGVRKALPKAASTSPPSASAESVRYRFGATRVDGRKRHVGPTVTVRPGPIGVLETILGRNNLLRGSRSDR